MAHQGKTGWPRNRNGTVGTVFRGLAISGGFPKGGFGGCSPGTKTGMRVRSHAPPERKPGIRAHSPKPLYKTALLSPLDRVLTRNRRRNWNRQIRFSGTECATLTQRNRRNRKPEPLEPSHPQTVTEPNRTGATGKRAQTFRGRTLRDKPPALRPPHPSENLRVSAWESSNMHQIFGEYLGTSGNFLPKSSYLRFPFGWQKEPKLIQK